MSIGFARGRITAKEAMELGGIFVMRKTILALSVSMVLAAAALGGCSEGAEKAGRVNLSNLAQLHFFYEIIPNLA